MLNVTILTGRLTADPTLTQTENSRYCRFSVAVDRPKRKDKEGKADFFNCVAWEGTAEIISKWYKKGDLITIVGNLRNSQYEKNGEKRTSTSVVVREVHFGNSKRKTENTEDTAAFPEIDPNEFEEIFSGEDVPF